MSFCMIRLLNLNYFCEKNEVVMI